MRGKWSVRPEQPALQVAIKATPVDLISREGGGPMGAENSGLVDSEAEAGMHQQFVPDSMASPEPGLDPHPESDQGLIRANPRRADAVAVRSLSPWCTWRCFWRSSRSTG